MSEVDGLDHVLSEVYDLDHDLCGITVDSLDRNLAGAAVDDLDCDLSRHQPTLIIP